MKLSPIYAIRPRGQVINYACQWLWEERRLAFRVIVLPILLIGGLLIMNALTLNNWIVYTILAMAAGLLLPVLPNMMFDVVENPEFYGYPERMPLYSQLLRCWRKYYWQFLVVTVFTVIASGVSTITIVGPLAIYTVSPLAIVILQREENIGFGCITVAAKQIGGSLMNFFMCVLGTGIIVFSMMGAPWFFVLGLGAFIKTFISIDAYNTISNLVDGDFFDSLALVMALFGGVFSYMISTVIIHFFYGHCVEQTSHPALIEKMMHFNEMKK